ncbi:probable Dol-P-Man:Man(7)GlcNAc(2)-PP-Dol alpha-1,6-mannosyltransferase [Pollicipes pollicipes]|uniref:probable Dol-P-Man:Man(7)GlcNAc(2)-PP-Dol alpha-1,6-mannosyltransferase n=1 Tax=Pollicipes pollicipes TaxID=41117 RepID=UPI001884C7F5|nr:probable Dol-P-Man:Man(7)GlcNAc(2)-PP-Dol alpha-1,6-mannosyltransferase [Pollicipes pollicipes]
MCCHLLVNCALTVLLAAVARHNYPGGAALARLHYLEPEPACVHLDVYAAQTGVTRFLQHRHDWRYNKTENLTPGSPEMHSFTHLLIEAKSKRSTSLKPYLDTHMILGSVDVFSHIQFNYAVFPPLRLRTRPAIFILYNKNRENVQWASDEGDVYEDKAAEPPAASRDHSTTTKENIDDESKEEGLDTTEKRFAFPDDDDDRFGGETRVQGDSRAEQEDGEEDSYLPPGVLR